MRDSFIQMNQRNKIIMIACVCPGQESTDHSVNTLRYADRLKAKGNKDSNDKLDCISKSSHNDLVGI